jgi:monoamine oxidase
VYKRQVDDLEICWWEEGVHYYKPVGKSSISKIIKKLSKPTKNIYVLGEVVSKKHGWVEGAIQSVDAIIH